MVDETAPATTPSALVRYDPVAVFLHWTMALAIIAMLFLGLTMEDYQPMSLRFTAINFHKALGITLLVLSIFRLVWRFMNPPPPLPAQMNFLERAAAHLSHWALYAFMIIMPLTGWLMVSASAKYPIIYFGLGEAPFIPMPSDEGLRKFIGLLSHNTHDILGYGAIALIILHVAAAIKHHVIDDDFVLRRMLPAVFTRSRR